MNNIGFPGFNIGPFEINPIAFSLFGRDIAWYGIFVTLGILCGIFYSFWRGQKNNGIVVDDMIDVAIFSIPAAIIGARLYYVIFAFDQFDSFYRIVAIWEGGLAVYGGIIVGFLTAFLVCKFKKISFLSVFDSTAPAIMLGQIIGRWGNFTNMEAYGAKTDVLWRMSIERHEILYSGQNYVRYIEVHPTFLYESIWNLIGFIIINLLYKKKKFDGQIFLMYITWYGLGRMFIEGFRVDSLYLGSFRISQVVGILCVIAGIALFIFLLSKFKTQKLEGEAYEGVYAKVKAKLPKENDNDNDDDEISEKAIENDEENENEESDEDEEQ